MMDYNPERDQPEPKPRPIPRRLRIAVALGQPPVWWLMLVARFTRTDVSVTFGMQMPPPPDAASAPE